MLTNKTELKFFDDQIETIVRAVLPKKTTTPEQIRERILKRQDSDEEEKEKNGERIEERDSDEFSIEFRRSIKTVEVMGSILKNRAGSLERQHLESLFAEAMNVHFRLLTLFFEIINKEEQQHEIVEMISDRLQEIIKDKERSLSHEEMVKIAKTLFWNINFSTVYGLIDKIVHSLGSNKLISVIDDVCEKNDTPATFLVKHGILMWYNKNLQVDNILKKTRDDVFSETANRIMKLMIVNHCSMHKIGFKEIQKIQSKFEIPSNQLLPRNI